MRKNCKIQFVLLFLTVIMIIVTIMQSVSDYEIFKQHPEYSASFLAYFVPRHVGFIIIIVGSIIILLSNKLKK